MSDLPLGEQGHLFYETQEQRLELLRLVLTADDSAGKEEELEKDNDSIDLLVQQVWMMRWCY